MRFISTALFFAACSGPAAAPMQQPEPPPEAAPTRVEDPVPAEPLTEITVQGMTGPITVTPVYHATTMIQVGDKTVWLDPWSKANYEGKPQADVVLLTDIHFDHLDAEAIGKVAKEGTLFVGPAAVGAELKDRKLDHTVANGETVEVAGMKITAVPMYNLVRGPDEGGVFHEKGRGNGYVIDVDGKRLYFAGDTECTDEMKALQAIDVAFIPMNLPYTMPPEEAAACVAAFKPKQVVPYHYAGSELDAFDKALATSGVQVLRAEFYPGGLPW